MRVAEPSSASRHSSTAAVRAGLESGLKGLSGLVSSAACPSSFGGRSGPEGLERRPTTPPPHQRSGP